MAVGLRQDAKGLARYLLPTRIAIGREGSLSLEAHSDWVLHSDLKIRFMDVGYERQSGARLSPGAEESTALVIGYVALVLRRVGEWFEQERRVNYPGMTPRWQLNVGMPSAGYDDAVMKHAYLQATRAAWWVSRQRAPVTIPLCVSAIAEASKPDFDCGLAADALSVVPEVAAEVVGYARSPLRSPGLHVLIDVGASTLDICGFVLHERDGDDSYSLLTADVQRLGAFMLHLHRLNRLRSLVPGDGELALAAGLTAHDPHAITPESVRDYLQQRGHAGGIAHVLAIDDEWVEECRRAVVFTVRALRRDRDPNSPRWSKGLPVFLAGGGSLVGVYRDGINAANADLRKAMDIHGLRILDLPRPKALDNRDIQEGDFRFLSVAYGLSHERFQIGDIQPPSEIGDVERKRRKHWEARLIEKDQV